MSQGFTRVICVIAMGLVCVAGAVGEMKAVGDIEVDSRVEVLPELPQGPFVKLGNGNFLTVLEDQVLESADGGATWESRALFAPDQNLKVSSERALVRTKNGVIVLVFMNMADYYWKWNAEKSLPELDTRLDVWSIRSVDEGASWTDAQMIYDGYCGDIHDMVETTNGVLVAPVQELMYEDGRHALRPRYSRDDGKTWHRSNFLDIGGRGHHDGLIEGTLIQLTDGRLWMLCRTNLERFWSAFSDNDGEDWRILEPSDIAASSSPGQLTRLDSGRLLLVWNRPLPEGADEYPRTGGDGQWSDIPVSNHRAELSIAFSDDDGTTWTEPVVVARKPKASLAYPYVFEPAPGTVWITTMQGNLRLSINESEFVD